MSHWGSKKARLVLVALLKIGWQIKRQSGGSHRVLAGPGWNDFVFAFHDGEEIGPRMLARWSGDAANLRTNGSVARSVEGDPAE